jgi:hypothetical protein
LSVATEVTGGYRMKATRIAVLPVVAILFGAWSAAGPAYCGGAKDGASALDEYLTALPAGISGDDTTAQEYSVTSVVYNRDIAGNVKNKIRLTARYTRWVEDGAVHCRWNDVRVAGTTDASEPFAEGGRLDYMEGFSYTVSEEIMGEDLYAFVPDENLKHLVKTLVWDAATFEPVFWDHFEEFKLNEQYVVADFEDLDVRMGDWGSLRMKDLKMAWVGVSKANEEPCAVIDYESFSNPVVSRTPLMNVDGRSLYWGGLWISLEDKQVERATLNEDVMMKLSYAGVDESTITDMQRDVLFAKVN